MGRKERRRREAVAGAIKRDFTDTTGFNQASSNVSNVLEEESAMERITDEKMTKKHAFAGKSSFEKKVIFADRPAYEKRSNNLWRESWSYHSLFPSMRTFVPLFALPFSTVLLGIFGSGVGFRTGVALWSLIMVAIGIAILFFFLESTKIRASHALKDTLIHAAIFFSLILLNWFNETVFKVFLLYLAGHWLLHAVDFHVERSKTRAITLLLIGGFLVFLELFLAVALDSELASV